MLLLGSKRLLRKLQKSMKRYERKGEMLPKLKKGKLRSLPGVLLQQLPLIFDAALQDQQADAC
jgi:hypothetical protein